MISTTAIRILRTLRSETAKFSTGSKALLLQLHPQQVSSGEVDKEASLSSAAVLSGSGEFSSMMAALPPSESLP